MNSEQLQRRKDRETPKDSDHRSPYELDRTRVIHSHDFRRLQGKTQILGIQETDYHRTRMTHSLEVSSLCVSLAKNNFIRLNESSEQGDKFLAGELKNYLEMENNSGNMDFFSQLGCYMI